MALADDPMAPVTRLTSLSFLEDGNIFKALYTPILSTEEILAIPVTEGLVGAIAFNKSSQELETYSAAGFWLPILTAESDINVETITAVTGNFNVINCVTINSTNSNTTNAHVTGNLMVDGVANLDSGGTSGDWGVNGNLTAGSIGTTGELNVDGVANFFDGAIITGDLDVTGLSTLDRVSCDTMDVSDFEASTARIDNLLYGQTANPSGNAPFTVTLGTGAGTGATCTIKGSNLGGTITITTGTSPAVGQTIGTFVLPVQWSPFLTGNWSVIMSPASATTAQYETTSNTYVTVGTGSNNFLMGGSLIALSASTTYAWNYMIVGNILGT